MGKVIPQSSTALIWITSNPRTILVIAVVLLFFTWPRAGTTSPIPTVDSTVNGKINAPQCPTTGKRYGIMMDAGSTGSRTHVFEFETTSSGTLRLNKEVFRELKPGLSSFAEDPSGAARSLVPLMEAAVEAVPAALQRCTPVALKATAGLRLLGAEKSDAILAAVNGLFGKYRFAVGADAAVVMDGRDEGPYAWLTVNFLLGLLQNRKAGRTAAILDMGGASTQIVFEPDNAAALSDAPREHLYTATYHGERFTAYQHSYLKLGLKEARKTLLRAAIERGGDLECLPTGARESIDGDTSGAAATNAGQQSFAKCAERVAADVVRKDAACSMAPCSFNGVYQPALRTVFSGPIYAFSYFYDRMEPFLPEDGVITVGTFREIGTKICEGGDEKYTSKNKGLMCLDFAFLHTLLSAGYGLNDAEKLYIKKKINDVETAWALGAMIVSMGL